MLAFAGAMLSVATISLVSTAGTVDRQLAAARADAAAISVVHKAAALVRASSAVPRHVSVELEDARADADVTRRDTWLVLNLTATGIGNGGIEVTRTAEVVIATDSAGSPTEIISWER